MLPELKYFRVLDRKGIQLLLSFLKEDKENFFSMVDSSKVVSLEQIRICYNKAMKLFESSDRIKRPESIFLMLLSGEKQISRAQDSVGVSESTGSFIVVFESESTFQSFLGSAGKHILRNDIPAVPERKPEEDGIMFSRMARIQLTF